MDKEHSPRLFCPEGVGLGSGKLLPMLNRLSLLLFTLLLAGCSSGPASVPTESSLTLDGKVVKVLEMEVFLGSTETFLIHGKGTELAGKLPESVGENEDFARLIGKTVEISSTIQHDGKTWSPKVQIDGKNIAVSGGSFKIERAIKNDKGSGSYLEGSIELQAESQTLPGRFVVLAKSYG